jgi:hypothetical protein
MSSQTINNATPIVAPIFIYLPTQFYAHVDGKIIPVQPVTTSPKVPYMAGTCKFLQNFQESFVQFIIHLSKKVESIIQK